MPDNPHAKHNQDLFTHHYHQLFQLSEAAALFLTNTLRSFSLSLVGIFIPIYIFRLSSAIQVLPATVPNALFWIFANYLLISIGVIISTFLLSEKLFSKIHLKTGIIISLIFLVIQRVLLLLAADYLPLILLAGFIYGTAVFLYWIPYHIFFIRKAIHGHNEGQQTGTRTLLTKLGTAAGPLIGGFIIKLFGFPTLFVVAMLTLLLTGVPLWVAVNESHHQSHNLQQILRRFLFSREYKDLTLAFSGIGIEAVMFAILWPVLLYVAVPDELSIGAITTFSSLVSAVGAVWIGKLIDTHGPQTLHKIGVVTDTSLYLSRMVITLPFALYSIDVIDRFSALFYSIPFTSSTYQKARRLGDSNFIVYREIVLHGSRILLLSLSLALLFILPNWRYLFLFPAAGALMTLGIDLDKH